MPVEILSTLTSTHCPRLLLTPRQAAEALNICEKTLWNLTKRGEVKAVRIGRSVRYDIAELQAFINRQKEVGHA